jgi:ParB family chromosome partitioning protein
MNKSNVQRPRLGRGLSSLINNTTYASDDNEYKHVTGLSPLPDAKQQDRLAQPGSTGPVEIRIDEIVPNPYQPRREFSSQELGELAQSITQQGILQPLIVTANDQPGAAAKYILIAGERRMRAAKLVGMATVPCVIRQATGQQMLEWALIENIQRSDLNPLERAMAYREYVDRFNLTVAQASERLGQPRTTVSNYLRVLELSSDVQLLIARGQLSFGHAKVLAGIVGNPNLQLELAQRAGKDDLSVRQLEGLISVAQAPAKDSPTARVSRSKPPYILDLQEQLTAAVGTRVTIIQGRSKNAGRIVIDYYSLDDFDRIAASLGLKVQS